MTESTIILDKIKKHLGIEKDTEFADYLGIKRTRLATWRKRNMHDSQILFAKCNFLNAEVLLGGDGELIKTKYTENVTLSKSNKKGNKKGLKRNIQKMLPFEVSEKSFNELQSKVLELTKELNEIKSITLFNAQKGNIVIPKENKALKTSDNEEIKAIYEKLESLEYFMNAVSLKIELEDKIEEIEEDKVNDSNLKKTSQLK